MSSNNRSPVTPPASDLETAYRRRNEAFAAEANRLRARYNRFSLVRLLVFALGLTGIISLWLIVWWLGLASIGFFLLAFYRFIRWHQAMQVREGHLRRMATINRNEAAAQVYDYQCFPSGREYLDPAHPYSVDLDLFGDFSLFQFCNRTGTRIGADRLAAMLSAPAPPATIRLRQGAIAELRPQLDWRQHLQAYGLEVADDKAHLDLLTQWVQQPPRLMVGRFLRVAVIALPLIFSPLSLYAFIFHPWYFGVMALLPMAFLLRRHVEYVNDVHRQTTHAERILRDYSRLIAEIETHRFAHPALCTLHQAFEAGASRAVNKLSYAISQLNVRYNFFAIFLNIFGLWDLHWVMRLEKWKEQHRMLLPAWFEALAEFEALNSLATLAYNHPHWQDPVIHERPLLVAEAIGHPLLHPGKMVSNDLSMPTRGHIKLITGSNMAGKSTLLRTLGLNIVLAMTGAPVCARRLELPPLEVYTSMRTQDALHESTSSFYAELKRLKFIIEAVEAGKPIFFLLDEILKGTNSKDRHAGSRALISQLIQAGGSGLVATHDLELGDLESHYQGAIENLCMEVAIVGDQLHFDYKLKKGVSQSFNATLLMRQMGIKIR